MDAILLGHGLECLRVGGNGQVSTMQLDPLPLAGALLARTQRIGVVAGWTVDFSEPFHVARVLATLDHLSYGRSGWLVQMFGTAALTPRIGRSLGTETLSDYWERAHEFIDAVQKLWDSWEDEAFAVDKPSGMFVDPDRVHLVDHHGRCFTIRGPLNVPRPPQGHPVLVHTDPDNADGRRLVVSTADVILTRYGTAAETAARSWELRRDRDKESLRVLADLCIGTRADGGRGPGACGTTRRTGRAWKRRTAIRRNTGRIGRIVRGVVSRRSVRRVQSASRSAAR